MGLDSRVTQATVQNAAFLPLKIMSREWNIPHFILDTITIKIIHLLSGQNIVSGIHTQILLPTFN